MAAVHTAAAPEPRRGAPESIDDPRRPRWTDQGWLEYDKRKQEAERERREAEREYEPAHDPETAERPAAARPRAPRSPAMPRKAAARATRRRSRRPRRPRAPGRRPPNDRRRQSRARPPRARRIPAMLRNRPPEPPGATAP